LWKRRAYPVEISAEQNFGEGQAFGPKSSIEEISV
jgi:hypothetical protein